MVFPPPPLSSPSCSLFILGPSCLSVCLSIRQWSRPSTVCRGFQFPGSRFSPLLVPAARHLLPFFALTFRGLVLPRACCPFSCLHILSIFNLLPHMSHFHHRISFLAFHFNVKGEAQSCLIPRRCHRHIHAPSPPLPPFQAAPPGLVPCRRESRSFPTSVIPRSPQEPVIIMPPLQKKNRTQLRPSPPRPYEAKRFPMLS